jgi:WD40 repeat protein
MLVALALGAVLVCSIVGEAVAQGKPNAEVVPQVGHSALVTSVAFSPNARQVLSGSQDSSLKLWDVASGTLLRNFEGHSGQVRSVAFSPDGRQVLSGSSDRTLKLWDATTGTLLRNFEGHRGHVGSVAFSPDGRQVLSGSSDNTLKLWDAASGSLLRNFVGHPTTVTSVAFSRDGRQVLSGSNDTTIRLWDAATGAQLYTFRGHSKHVHSVAFSPDGRQVLSGSNDKTIRLWDAANGALLRTFEGHTHLVTSVAFSPDGKQVLSGDMGSALRLWDAASGAMLRKMEAKSAGISSVAYSSDGKQVLSGGYDNAMKLWDATSGGLQHTFVAHSKSIGSVAFSPDGRQVRSNAENEKLLRIWDAASGTLQNTIDRHSFSARAALSPDGRQVLSVGGHNTELKLWDVASGALLRTFAGHSDEVWSVAFSPDGRQVLSGGYDQTLKLWDAASGSLLRTFGGHSDAVWSVAYSPDGRLVLSGSKDGTMKLWDATSGTLLRTFKWDRNIEIYSVAFSPDGRQIVSGNTDRTMKLWDAASGSLLRNFEGHSGNVRSVAFSPDGRQLLSGSEDHTLKLWDGTNGTLLRTLKGHSGWVTSVAFSPDGRHALSGGRDGTVRIWQVATGELLLSCVATPAGDWLSITPNGFFASSGKTSEHMLNIVRGMDVTTVGQVHQSLFNPDLVRASLAGDPEGEVAKAGKVVNLEKVIDAGPAPLLTITSPKPGSTSRDDLVTVAAHVEDRGKGIGRIQWRVNGITAGISTVAPSGSRDVQQIVGLDQGENQIEVIAYEGRNVLASLPARIKITYNAPPDNVKPKLYVLAIGINAYVDEGGKYGRFAPLEGSVPDAKAFADEMRTAAADQYEKVSITLALDEHATRSKLEEAIDKIASDISPRDTFVLYAATHGYSVPSGDPLQGTYFMIPQDYQGGGDPEALKSRAIGQERIQEWLGSRIKAKRAVILLDTCESGALTSGYIKSRTDGPVSEASVGRLHEATGRPVITAASPGKSAYENYKGHGVFTYALIEALHMGDTNNNSKIEVGELATHVARRVPELFAELKQSGWVVKGLAARGGGGDAQSAHFGSTGEDFSLVGKLP